jgi:uncharacterized protein YhaN
LDRFRNQIKERLQEVRGQIATLKSFLVLPRKEGSPEELDRFYQIERDLKELLQKGPELRAVVGTLEKALGAPAPKAPPKAKRAGRPGSRGKGPAKKATAKPADPQSEEIERLRREKGRVDDDGSRLVGSNDALERRIAALEKQIRRVTDGLDRAYEQERPPGDGQWQSFREFFDDYRRTRM